MECPPGRFALRLARVAAEAHLSSAARVAKDLQFAAAELMGHEGALETALCSGWPVFGLLVLLEQVLAAVAEHELSMKPSAGGLEELRKRFPAPSVLKNSSSEEAMAAAMQAQIDGLVACTSAARSDASASSHRVTDCLTAFRGQLEELQGAQARSLLGFGVCPSGSIAAWLDRDEPSVPAFPLCVYSGREIVSDTIKHKGKWAECYELGSLLEFAGRPGCLVVDVGANIGACTLLLTRLGYDILAFEPLRSNVELIQASLVLNEPLAFLCGSEQKESAGTWGHVGVLAVALSDRVQTESLGRESMEQRWQLFAERRRPGDGLQRDRVPL
ncbi:unnamed protein product [Polarella glacialis]|uniref:Uncharacterized protein n=1 Tax=Polarella glacialis TaxID=89957 RepID=A0A813LDE7_POLGL|nr:unnamed protein product [Polarella glacialis]